MNTTIIQVPVEKRLRDEALVAARVIGFSSLQDAIRLYLKKLARGVIDIAFEETVQLSPRAVRRYNKIADEIDSGKEVLYEAKDVNDLLEQLHGKKNPVPAKVLKKLHQKN